MKKKILIVITSLVIGGGAERVASVITNKLSHMYDFSILTFYDYKNTYPYSGNYYSLKEEQTSLKKFLIPFKIHRYIKKISPDLIISFMDHTNMVSIITKIIYRLKIPLIVSVRINPERAYKESRRYYNYLIRFLYKLKVVSRIVDNSRGIQSVLENKYKIPVNKLKTILNGVEIDEIKNLAREPIEDQIFNEKNVVKFINIGRLSGSKNHKLLIEAFKKLQDEFPEIRLIIIGDGPLKADLINFIDNLNLQDKIYLLGLRSNPFKYLARSDVFVLSSDYEGMPNVLLEAMACDLPIISTSLSGTNEILKNGEYGLLSPTNNIEELAKNMRSLVNNRELWTLLSRKASKRILDFDYNVIIKEWESLISGLTS